jgi:hypothetical protein
VENTGNLEKYLKLNDWSIDFDDINIDSFSQSVFKLTGDELEINIENWKLEKDIPQFLIGNLQKNITNTLGLYEWRVKFNDFFALTAFSSISNEKGFHYTPIDYSGDSPNKLSIDSWHYFPIKDLEQSISNYTSLQCNDTSQVMFGSGELENKINFKSQQYNCKACNCRQSICFDEPIYEQYHTLSLVLTAEYATFFIDGVLMYTNTLGANDSISICPLSETECTKNSVLSLNSGIIQNGNDGDFALRNDMWNYLLTGNEVKWTIDYFRKYDFKKSNSSTNFLQSYEMQITVIDTKNYKLNKKAPQMSFISDSSLLLISKKNELLLSDKNGKIHPIVDKKTNETIRTGGDFVISPTNDIFFVNPSGYIEMLKKDSLGNFYKEKLLSPNPIQRVKNTDYQDITFLDNEGEIEIIFKTRQNSIGRYLKNRGRWYFIEMTSKAAVRIEGDIQTGKNGKIFYRGNDGYLHGMQVKGKKRQSFHINVRPLGSKTPKVSKSIGAFAITDKDEIVYVNTDNQLIHFYLEKERYKIKFLTKKSKLKCEQIAGRLIWMNTNDIKQLLFFDKENKLCGLEYSTKNKKWNRDDISLMEKKVSSFGFKQQYRIAYNDSEIIYFNPKNQLITYELVSSPIKINDGNYALYVDESHECQNTKVKGKKVLNASNRRLSDF